MADIVQPGTDDRVAKLRGHLDASIIAMKADRMSWWLHWRELADYVLPRRYKWLITPNQMNRGSPMNQRIIDSTGTLAWRVLASGMQSGVTSPARPWFRLTFSDPRMDEMAPVKAWLDEVRRRMLHVFAESNFYTSIHTAYGDLACFGTAPMIEYEDYDDVVRFYNPCAGEYFAGISNRYAPDMLGREFTMTARQSVQEFGIDAVSEDVKVAHKTGGAQLFKESVVNHMIEPNDNYDAGGKSYRDRPFRECYWQNGSSTNLLLREKYYHENPVIIGRWDTVSNDAYGRSPAMDGLGDIKQLQVEQKRKAQAIDKMVNPPMVADVALKNQPLTQIPGGVTYVPSTNTQVGFKPVYEVDPKIQELKADIQEVQQRVKTCFFYDLFLMISQLDTVRSATEIAARKEEKLIMLGPVLERIEGELLEPIINRTYGIMMRAGLLPPPPREIRGKHFKAEFISVLAQAQKAVMTSGIERLAGFVGSISAGQEGKGGHPDILDNIDWDEMVDQYADMLGTSTKLIIPYAKVLKVRAQRAQQQAQAADAQNALAAVQGAKVMSETQTGAGKNALQQMIGG